MIDERFVLLGIVLNLYGSATYAYNTLRGKTKPNRVTWFLWALAPLIGFAAQLQSGVSWASVMTFMVGFGPLIVLIASFLNREAYWQITRFDIWCGVVSLAALALWLATGTGLVALIFSILADAIAAIPTLRKAWFNPETEDYRVFRNGALSAAITLLTIEHWYFMQYGFALYIGLVCTLFYVLIKFRPQQR